jgi:hypothetical protein
MQFSNRRWHTFCVPQWARACEHVARCWADALPENIASKGRPSMATRAIATIRRAIIRSPQNAARPKSYGEIAKRASIPVGRAALLPHFLLATGSSYLWQASFGLDGRRTALARGK